MRQGRQLCCTFRYHKYTASIKPSLLFPPCRQYFLRTFPFYYNNLIYYSVLSYCVAALNCAPFYIILYFPVLWDHVLYVVYIWK